ncbi:hypothetical protein V1279_001316 [Bradyrhizobium sp. AZCC 1610]|uniref:hypothetical protein n=1 Tax=Bradyrhizobium sp. AZCC 1610 TaxID=3117020 RepID=UPI002FEFBB5A
MFKNLALTLGSLQSTPGYAYPAILDVNGYPTATPTNNIYGIVKFPSNFIVSNQMVLKWKGTGTIQLGRGSPGFSIISGENFVSGGTGFNLKVVGTNPRVVFTFVSSVPASVSFSFVAGEKFSGMSNVVLCKLSDESAIDRATTPEEMFADDYIGTYQLLAPSIVRPMGWTNPNFGNVSQLRYVAPWRTSINISSQRWVPGAWAGSTSGINEYTCSAPPDAAKTYVDGEMIHLQFAQANTATNVTINSGGRGPVRLLVGTGAATGQPMPIGKIAANSLATLTYDAVLKAFMWQPDGQMPCIPYELQIAFANRVNANYWCNFSGYMDDASVKALTALVRDKLRLGATAYFEYGNEIWNNGFPATRWAFAKGAALGFPADNNRQVYGWYGLRVRQIMGIVTSTWSPRSLAELKRVMAFQAFGPVAGTSIYRMQGADLNGASYPVYAKTGYPNYNVAPNRPIDYCDVLSYATYYSGAQCTNFDVNYVSNGASNIAGLLAAADDYASAVPSKMASALAFLDNDIRAGTLRNGSKGAQTLLALSSGARGIGIYPAWEAVATTFNKFVECYEGGHESWYPSTQTCTTLGISSSYGGPSGEIANLLTAYKMSPAFSLLVQDQLSQFMAHPHSRSASWLLIPGLNQWALSTGDNYAPKFKSWDALLQSKL